MKVEFTLDAEPVAKARARAGAGGRFYTPKKTSDYESIVALQAKVAIFGLPKFDSACCLSLVFHMPIPKSWSQKKRAQAISGEIKHTSKPDLDNLIKAIKDGLNGIVWVDDAQVVRVVAEKKYSENPGVECCVESYVG
jgi:Holliday junction resolvase RusA-like endonuclease